ncbi:type II toxin-antitoxin system HigB family toxin [Pseudomonas parafulva]|uniref:type II toxin-antitoxin system HigB family toxin n=1 Tax=Pseudomonas TaxID=286 RepID=UPI0018D6C20D|nr:type II toxin-antitoxin system HigB family toxin [Pseudomonas parafulva]MBH3343706.1 type II toxin-antitoxin system HigB family toxin [Pseudomonas parafulva]
MRVIAKSSLVKFWEMPGNRDAKAALESWYDLVIKATWLTPQDVKDQLGNARICGRNRIVFNIGGNKYRLVMEMQYKSGIAWVKFVGTHECYDEIDVETVCEY